MQKIAEKKLNELKQIIYLYENYKGFKNNVLIKELNKIKCKLTVEEYNLLIIAVDSYQDYICRILAETKKVFVSLKDRYNIEDKDVFNDID